MLKNKKQRHLLTFLMILSLVIGFISPVSSQKYSSAAKQPIKLNKSKVTIKLGKTYKLKTTTSKKNAKIKWSTSNKKVATVTQKGKVTGKKVGKANITAKIKGTSKKAICKVIVKKSENTSSPTASSEATPDASSSPQIPMTEEEKAAYNKIVALKNNYPEASAFSHDKSFSYSYRGKNGTNTATVDVTLHGAYAFPLILWFAAHNEDKLIDLGDMDLTEVWLSGSVYHGFEENKNPVISDIRVGDIIGCSTLKSIYSEKAVVIGRSGTEFTVAEASNEKVHWETKVPASAVKSVFKVLGDNDPTDPTESPEPSPAEMGDVDAVDSGINMSVQAKGEYSNWEGVSNVSQFKTASGDFCFAADSDSSVKVVTVDRTGATSSVTLQKPHSLFGAVTVDANGNYYMVTGEQNTTSDTSVQTVFLSKYDSTGKLIKTIGDNGSSSLAYYYDESFYTQMPFDGGNCDVAINGNYLAINYAREMYSGHQSNSVWMVDLSSFSTVKPEGFTNYNSHSFGQRAIPYGNGFSFLSWGDCYNRAFSVSTYLFGGNTYEGDLFHFWVREGAFTDFNMSDVNNTFAKIGNISDLGNGTISHVGLSAKSLSADAKTEKKQIFIQIFDPTANLSNSSSYVTSGERSGIAGRDGNEPTTDHGVVWLTNETENISYVQSVADTSGNTIILFQKSDGVYAMKVDKTGKVIVASEKISSSARLNPCETPVYTNGKVYWAANSTSGNKVYIFSCSI